MYNRFLLKTYNKENKHYATYELINLLLAKITVYNIKYPLIIKWNNLKHLGVKFINFKKYKNTVLIIFYIPIRNAEITNYTQLANFINNYIKY